MKLWMCMVVVRFILVFVPQTGYIHPDEFFQTVEITAGDVFAINVYTPWEFNSTYPIRSIVFPSIVAGLPLKLQLLTETILKGKLTSYWVLVTPRLAITFLTLLIDFCVYRLAHVYKVDTSLALSLASTSYVMLTFLTRTFTNTIEAILLSVLLLLLMSVTTSNLQITARNLKPQGSADNHKTKKHYHWRKKSKHKSAEITQSRLFTEDNVAGSDDVNKSDNSVKENPSKNKCLKKDSIGYGQHLKKGDHAYILLVSILVGVIIMSGIFNRPTFVGFILWPLLCLCYFLFSYRRHNIFTVLCGGGFGIFTTFCLFVMADSLYFRNDLLKLLFIRWESCLTNMNISISCFCENFTNELVVTPLNFVSYNIQSENLAQHGIHPKYLHFLVNLPLLFGPLACCIYYNIFLIFKFLYNKNNESFDWSSASLLMGILVPVFILSIFPHQEARFLLPIFPLIIVMGTKALLNSGHKELLMFVWIFFNILPSVMFGFLQQGGVVSSLQYIQSINAPYIIGENVHNKEEGETIISGVDKYIYFHTYMPPRFLLLNEDKFNNQLIDFKGADFTELKHLITEMTSLHNTSNNGYNQSNIYVLLPGTIVHDLRSVILCHDFQRFRFHLSLEDPPDLWSLLKQFLSDISLNKCSKLLENLDNQLSLHMCVIK